jgi:hypothetical protein
MIFLGTHLVTLGIGCRITYLIMYIHITNLRFTHKKDEPIQPTYLHI